MILNDKVVVVTGGTGSLCKVMVRRILSGEYGCPKKLIIFSRDEESSMLCVNHTFINMLLLMKSSIVTF